MQSAKPPRPKPPASWPAQSPHTVLIRNLQILGFDRLEDWPGITPRTLSPSSQNQRQRVKAIEWVLYHLVAHWDPEIARDKLRPFFPPLEPLQSVNLRAALFRVLSELKKNGDLGREITLRKSMLDDCKGEKLDELLAGFSTSVVRRISIQSQDNTDPAFSLASAQGLTHHEYQRLLPLILAHRVSLRTLGERSNRIRTAYETFAQLLDSKKDQLDARFAVDSPTPNWNVDLEGLGRDIKANWQGSTEWAEAILSGGLSSGCDAFLELPFDAAWSQAKDSTVDGLRTSSSRPDLVTDLESRVLHQRARLQRWRQYTATLQAHGRSGLASPSTATSGHQGGTALTFRDHQALTVASIAKAVRQPVDRASPAMEDQSLLLSISEALSQINHPSPRTQEPAQPHPSIPQSDPNPKPGHSLIPVIHAPQPITQAAIPGSSEETSSTALSPPIQPTVSEPDLPPIEIPEEEDEGHRYTLVERTRKSMSLVPPPRENPRPRPRASRVSFPTNQFDTPPKVYDIPSRASTPRDELFDDQADYASVFKSRPRIALSPITSPAVHVSPIGDFDLGANLDQDLDLVGMGSPLASRRRI